MCTEALSAEGYETSGACYAEEALRLASENRFDVVITDLVMPYMDGLRLLENVKQQDPGVVVIVVTGYASVENAVRAIRQGAYDFLAKPFTVDELSIAVARALERRRLEEENRSLKRLASLFQDLRTLGSATDFRQLDRVAVEVCQEQVKAKATAIAWLSGQQLSLTYSRGLPDALTQGFSIPSDDPVIGEVAKTLSPLLIENISEEGRSLDSRLYLDPSVIAAPASTGKGPLGVLFASGKRDATAFSQTDLTILSIIAAHTAVSRSNIELLDHTKTSFIATIGTLMATLESRDTYARRHSERVADYGYRIAAEMGLPDDDRESVRTAAYLHDIGKVGIRDDVLLKPGLFTPQDRQIMQKHPVIGSQILSLLQLPSQVSSGVRHHHERPNGTGYPDGLSDLPISPQIIGAADAYEALTADRHYHHARSPADALHEIEANIGTQFTPEPVQGLRKALNKTGELSLSA